VLSIVSPRAWLLLFLFIMVGWQQLSYVSRRVAQLTAAAIVLASTSAAIMTARFPERPSAFARPLAPQPNAVYSGSPVTTSGGVFYESILRDRYVIERWQDGRFEPFIADGHAFHPSLPDSGTKLYFELVADGRSSVAFFDLPGHQFGVLPVGRPDPRDPAVSHDGRILAFVSRGELCLFDGRTSRELASSSSMRDPSFVPGDGALVYATNESLHSKINSVDVHTGQTTSLVEAGAELARPSISPDGKTLLYASRQTGSWQIRALNVSNNSDFQLTAGRCNSFAPAWMPDSTEIVFATDCGRGLYLPRLDRMPIHMGPSASLAAIASTQK
jgi:tricorn protease-like protein